MRIARLLSLIALVATAASVARTQQPQDKNGTLFFAPRIAFLPASHNPPLLAFSSAVRAPLLSSETRDDESPLHYIRPTFHERFRFYLLSTYGPIRMTELAFGSAISQMDNVPPEWRQGWGAYGKRFASDVGSTAADGTTGFALAEALHLDTRYYPCQCKGILPRIGHALKSAVTARAGEDGHTVFSIPALASPYAGAFSTLLWYPSRYGPKDAFRTGNYDLADWMGERIAVEFLSPLLRKVHLLH